MIFPVSLKNGWSDFFLTSFYSLLWLTSLQFWGPQSLSVGNNFRLGRGPIWGAFDVRCWRQFDGHVSRSACICLHSDEAQAPRASSGYCSTQQSALFSLTWGLRTKSSLGGLYTVVYMYFNDFLFLNLSDPCMELSVLPVEIILLFILYLSGKKSNLTSTFKKTSSDWLPLCK